MKQFEDYLKQFYGKNESFINELYLKIKKIVTFALMSGTERQPREENVF
jgi:hypothetical protein